MWSRDGVTHRSYFWQKKAFLSFLSPDIRRISVSVISFYSLGSKTTWKGASLVLWIISTRALPTSWNVFQQKLSNNASVVV
jgi:uncharacterized membrane protein YwaF